MNLLYYLTAFFIGIQISKNDLIVFGGNYNYKKGLEQYVTFFCLLIGIISIICDILYSDICLYTLILFCSVPYSLVALWMMAKMNSKSVAFSFVLILLYLSIVVLFSYFGNISAFSIALILGVISRNNVFGAQPHLKSFLLFSRKKKVIWHSSPSNNLVYNDIDFSYAGQKKCNFSDCTIYNVCEFGIIPNKYVDNTLLLQKLIDKVGEDGGGIIYFPRGTYYFNTDSNCKKNIQINHSNIHFRGELANDGIPIAKLVNCNSTSILGEKNPWLSPFFITTGENLQRSNIFWGLQFTKKKNIVTRSMSMTDPGSDGTILTPEYIGDIIENAYKGDDLIKVIDTNIFKGIKYILIGMYNTTDDGNLIKDILGVDFIREEWKTALRAGKECAPSYQWLVEIEEILDENTLRLSRPLLRDISVKYTPKVYKAEMLENISITNLHISSKWNGVFRHHGHPRFYSVKQAVEMDYGWNAVNFKRVTHSLIQNVVIENFTNPIYVMDSRNVTVEQCVICGHDGHQGIKIYEHTCDCLFKRIVFYNHFADMMGGEGNAYGNVFDNVSYSNPYFKPVDYDFHGFSEGPMSPPSHNLFINIYGFRNIKGAGTLYNQPACAQYNIWSNCIRVGNLVGEPLFCSSHYCRGKYAVPRNLHDIFFKNSIIVNWVDLKN